MTHMETSGGRMFSVLIEGAPATVKDYMVAAHLYLAALEAQFPSATRLLACYRAWQRESTEGRSVLTPREIDLTSRWLDAHHAADRNARATLSDPANQQFVFQLVGDAPAAASPNA
jgi:hypothetical protein